MPIDIARFRTPLRAGSSHYDLDTGICLADALELDALQIIDTQARAEFVHETAHWLTEALTSIGQWLVFLKCVRDADLFIAAATDDEVRALFRNRLAQGEQGSPIIPNWHRNESVHVTGSKVDGLLDKWAGNFRSELALLYGDKLPITFEDRVWHLAGAMELYAERQNAEDFLDNPSFSEADTDTFIRNSLVRHARFVGSVNAGELCETVDLVEAVAVCAEVIWAHRQGVFGAYSPSRLQELDGSSYLAPIRQILASLGEALSADTILRFSKVLLIVLECSLNPPLPPIEEFKYEDFDYTHLFPPMRFNKALQALARTQILDGIQFDQTYERSTDSRLQATLYGMMDPPGRDFRVHLPETNDFSVFNALPKRAPLENTFAWFNNKRMLTPYHLRLWSAGQLKLDLQRSGVITLTQAILATGLSRLTRHCEPLLTLRSQALGPAPEQVPVRSQFLQTPEVLEWFLVHSAVQYAGADFMAGSGVPDYAGFLHGAPFQATQWAPEIRRRAQALFHGLLRVR